MLLCCFFRLLPLGFHALRICFNSSVKLLPLQLSAMDVSVRSAMKGAAKCDKHCELQNSVNRQGLERILCSRGSLSACLVQCLCFAFRPFVVELASPAGCELLGFRKCAGTLETFSASGFAVSASLLNSCWFVVLNCIRTAALLLRHEVRLANPLNLSI